MNNVNWVAFSVFIFFFAVVTVLGFVAARWRKANLNELAAHFRSGAGQISS